MITQLTRKTQWPGTGTSPRAEQVKRRPAAGNGAPSRAHRQLRRRLHGLGFPFPGPGGWKSEVKVRVLFSASTQPPRHRVLEGRPLCSSRETETQRGAWCLFLRLYTHQSAGSGPHLLTYFNLNYLLRSVSLPQAQWRLGLQHNTLEEGHNLIPTSLLSVSDRKLDGGKRRRRRKADGKQRRTQKAWEHQEPRALPTFTEYCTERHHGTRPSGVLMGQARRQTIL